jgi:hypothetical protein
VQQHFHTKTKEEFMAESNMALYTAVYESVSPALEDLGAIEELHDDSMIGKYDAAVIDLKEGKPHIVKRVDRPHIRVIPEMFGGGALPRKDLKEAAQDLTGYEAGLVVVGEPTLEKAFDKAVTHATKVVKHSLDATAGEIEDELKEANKETS